MLRSGVVGAIDTLLELEFHEHPVHLEDCQVAIMARASEIKMDSQHS
jgi:hypothetical protein